MTRPRRPVAVRAALSATAALVALLVAPVARAEDTVYVSPGLVGSAWTEGRFGGGGEVSFGWMPHGSVARWAGGFVQAEWLVASDGDPRTSDVASFRGSMGPQLGVGPFGLEVGLDYRSGVRSDGEGHSLGLRVAPFVSVGYVYTSVSLAWLPVRVDDVPGSRPVGLSAGFTVGFKLPLALRGDLTKNVCPHC